MKRLLLGLFAMTLAFSGIVNADPDRPSPLKGVMMPFPWENISGVWDINDPGLGLIYSFEVKTTADGNKVLEVLQVKEKTGEVIAQGAGVAVPGDKNTVSVMMAGEDADPYMLYVRHIREKRYSRKKFTVLTIKTLGDPAAPTPIATKEYNYKLNRVSEAPFQSRDDDWEEKKN